ncbi:putative transposase [Trichococcus patagoniensis]|uniref:Putative transposase n=1 Tax=Trichococcus patagoniensis TaxID=382641 RepID=A0A2T5IHK7_9LACT|nr:RNA-guided endonuclease TnpB family protein [Trichococcus patagoniensis]PTQ83298.1 putative transposase [Trichococcus patagoniensis]
MILKGVKVRLYPTAAQQEAIENNFRLNRFLWNQLLGMQIARHENGGSFVNKFGMNYLIKAMKIEFPFLKEAESTSLLYTSADLADSYDRFFKKQNGFPGFKSRRHPKNSYKSNCVNGNIQVADNHCLKLPKLGLVKANGLQRVKDRIKSVVVRKKADGTFEATLLVAFEAKTFASTGKAVGIDLGLTDLASQSDGFKLRNKQFERSLAKRKRQWQRKFARRRLLALKKIEVRKQATGENLELSTFKNVQKAKEQVARINKKIANQRNDYLQKYTTRLVKKYDLIAMEDLKTKNFLQNHHLSRSISDAAWARIKSMLAYKCEWYGKELVLVNPAYTSQICAHCGENTGKKPLCIRTFDCPHCHTTGIDRDVNAAINILNKALAQR